MKSPLPQLLGLMLCLVGTSHATTLVVDPGRSRIQVDAKATGHSFTGTLEKYTAKVAGDATTLAPLAFDLSWSFQDLKTAEADRDAAMLKWLGDQAPQGSFKFVKGWTDPQGTTNAQGILTIHGVSKTITFPYTAQRNGDTVTISGKVALDYQNFNLPLVRAMLVMTVDPQLVVRFQVVGKVK